MKLINIKEAAQICGGELHADKAAYDIVLGRAVIDSRTVENGDMFVAYKGDNTDGHKYISSAFDKGAVCCLAERIPDGETRPIILVDSVQTALEKICTEYRNRLNMPIVGITGSVGKTSAKEMTYAVLSKHFSVLKTEGNLNNQIGVPMTVSAIEQQHNAAVIELGISHFGDMDQIASIVRPTVAVFTIIGHAHLEFLQDLDGVMREKTSMIDHMDENGIVIYNSDDPKLRKLTCKQRRIGFGTGENADVRATDIKTLSDGSTSCNISYGQKSLHVYIPAYGTHMIYAALIGASVGFALGLSDEEIISGIAAYKTVGRRAAVLETGYITLIDDSYNANPDSVKSGINSLVSLPGRHICVFGDMLELGENSAKMHYDIGEYALKSDVDIVFTSGTMSKNTALGAMNKGKYFETKEELLNALKAYLRKGDSVLVKASNGCAFKTVSDELKGLK